MVVISDAARAVSALGYILGVGGNLYILTCWTGIISSTETSGEEDTESSEAFKGFKNGSFHGFVLDVYSQCCCTYMERWVSCFDANKETLLAFSFIKLKVK